MNMWHVSVRGVTYESILISSTYATEEKARLLRRYNLFLGPQLSLRLSMASSTTSTETFAQFTITRSIGRMPQHLSHLFFRVKLPLQLTALTEFYSCTSQTPSSIVESSPN